MKGITPSFENVELNNKKKSFSFIELGILECCSSNIGLKGGEDLVECQCIKNKNN